MKKFKIILFLLFITFYLNGQSIIDTVFLDSKWKETTYEHSIYYRTIYKDSDGLYTVKDYWKTGEIQMTGKYSALLPETRQGKFTWYYKSGNIKQIINFKNNNILGLVEKFDTKGNLDLQYIVITDSLDNAKEFHTRINDFRYFVEHKIRYPKNSRNDLIEGEVLTKFYINKKGDVERLTILKSKNEELDNKAKRVILSYKKWPIPIYKGEATYIEFIFPVIFALR